MIRSPHTSSNWASTLMRTSTMFSRICKRYGNCSVAAILIAALATVALAQGVEPSMLLKPSADSWPTYHGDYSGQRHSRLTEITPENVHRLGLAWSFQTGLNAQIKASPILANGIVYLTAPD